LSPKVGNYIWQISQSTGSGNIELIDNPSYEHFSSEFGIGINNKFYYGIHNRASLEWEVGYGYMLDASTLVRESILRSSNLNNLVSFTAGPKDVISDVPAQYQNHIPNLTFNDVPSGIIDGVNLEFTLSGNFISNTTQIYLNGLRQKIGLDYTEVQPNKISFLEAPLSGYTILADYIKS